MKLRLIFLVVFMTSIDYAFSQSNSLVFEYETQKISLGIPKKNQANSTYITTLPDFAGLATYTAALKQKGDRGFELVSVEPYITLAHDPSYQSDDCGINLTFKRSHSPGEEYLNNMANRIDSIANNYVRKEIAKEKIDLMVLINETTKSTIGASFIDEVTKIFNAMLTEKMGILKQQIIQELKSQTK